MIGNSEGKNMKGMHAIICFLDIIIDLWREMSHQFKKKFYVN